ncbi:phosphate system positive regulatory protein pho81 [Lunasporangiospora selenospora]|uniref:Phosphate system positive regulatory protein pho81 n=1 Tax=Lunasporangiospora selenospora TaxID=979761 RepID=A0A9P6FS60_9FUNG|nr:phosphate system positive regulatory protein pho81 [Lunasporangiospora selenospora]
MKFGKQIQFQQITEWQNHYMNYKGLKKIINSLIQDKAQSITTISASPPPGLPGSLSPPTAPSATSSDDDHYSRFLQSQKAAFFFKLERELEKVNSFYLQKESELKVRLRSLIDKEKIVLTRQGRPGTSSSINSLREAYRQFQQDLNKLQKFVETNGTGFRKILKKWDKRSKSSTKELYLSRQVELQPCFNQDAMVELADNAAYHLLGLENIQQQPGYSSNHAGNGRNSSNPSSPISATASTLGSVSAATGPTGLDSQALSSPAQLLMDELESDLFTALTTNQVSVVQELLSRRLAAPSALENNSLSTSLNNGSNSASTNGDSNNSTGSNNGLVGLENAREAISRVFWRCCSETSVSDSAIQHLVRTGLINFKFVDDISDRTCLHEAAMVGRLSLLKLGVEHGASPESTDVYGRRPLHYVSMYGHADCATYLLSMKASMTATDHDGFRPLIYSVMNGHTNCVKIFLAHGVEIEACQEGDPIPLSLACQYGHEDIAMMLIGRGANVIASNADGLEPLHITCREGHTRLARTLTTRGARLDQEDKYMCWTPLFYAASEGHADCVRILLEAGCKVNVVDELGKTPIYYAASEGHASCVQLLLDAGGEAEGGKAALGIDGPIPVEPLRSTPLTAAASTAAASSATAINSAADHALNAVSGMSSPPQMDELDMDFIPTLALPPPIIPFRIYGHNYLDKKCQVNLTLGHPNFPDHSTESGQGQEKEKNKKNRSGTKTPVHLYGTSQISSLKLIISSRPDNGMIPHNVILPLGDEREVFGFQVDSLEHFTVEFEIFPTFGSKAIGRAVALPSLFMSEGPGSSSIGKAILPLFDAHLKVVGEVAFEYSVIRPFEGVRLEVGGRVETYWKSTNSIDSSANATATTATSTPVTGTPSVMPVSTSTFAGGMFSSSQPFSGGGVGGGIGGGAQMIPSYITASSLSGEYIQLSIQLTRDLVPVVFANWYLPVDGFDLAISDVSFSQFRMFGEMYSRQHQREKGGNACDRISDSWRSSEWRRRAYERWMSLEQVLKILPKHIGVNLELKYPTLSEQTYYRLTNCVKVNKFVDTILQTVYDSSSATHHPSVMISSFNPVICSAVNWKQPNYAVFFSTYAGYDKSKRSESAGLARHSNETQASAPASTKRKEPMDPEQLPSPKHGSAAAAIAETQPGSISMVLGNGSTEASPLSDDATTTCNAGTSLLTRSGAGSTLTSNVPNEPEFCEDDKRCLSIKEAVRFARSNNLLGVICEATPLVQVPSLITHIKEAGLILSSFGVGNRDLAWVQIQRNHGIDALMVTEDYGSDLVTATGQGAGRSEKSSSSSSRPSTSLFMGGTGLGSGTTGLAVLGGLGNVGGGGGGSSGSIPEVEEGVLRYQNGVDSGLF